MQERKHREKMSRRQLLKRAADAATASPTTLPSEVRPLRSSQPREQRVRAAAPPSMSYIALTRMTFGIRPGDLDVAYIDSLPGATEEERVDAFIEEQLAPDNIDDSALEARLAASNFSMITPDLTNLTPPLDPPPSMPPTAEDYRRYFWQHPYRDPNDVGWDFTAQPANEMERYLFTRAVFTRKQLLEVMVHFWLDHFHIYGWDTPQISLMSHYVEHVLRPHALGNFRALLEEVARSTQMLYFLDNYTNSRSGPNENWGRELFELHTMGSENYLGTLDQSEVPPDPQDPTLPLGYVDGDIYETARAFTGWTISNDPNNTAIGDRGDFLYRDGWHDKGNKVVLKKLFGLYGGLEDGLIVLDLVSKHPGTARHLARKLVERLVSDDAPQALVDSAADIWYQNWEAPDQIAQVVRHILQSTAFKTTWGAKVKRPMEAAISSMRIMASERTIEPDDDFSNRFLNYFDQTGNSPFIVRQPNGFPDSAHDWLGTTSIMMRWRVANWLTDARDPADDSHYIDLMAQHPPEHTTSIAIADFWIDRVLGRAIDPIDRTELIDFMAQGTNPEFPLNLEEDRIKERIRALVGLLMMSTYFQEK